MPVLVRDYDPRWPERAAALTTLVMRAGSGSVTRVEHIGSTAIPGMAAKDVIDLQARVDDLDRATAVLDAPLAAAGFERLPWDHDHVPAGWNDDPERWVKRLWSRRGHPDGDVNLHARLADSPNERLALLFRDWFRAHPDAVPAYAQFKRTLAAQLDAFWSRSLRSPLLTPQSPSRTAREATRPFLRELEQDMIGVYSDVKDPVVDLVITVAQSWAAETGWTAS